MQFHIIRSKTAAFFQRIGPGLLLGVFQLDLLFLGINRLGASTTIIVGMVLYVVIPGLAGLRSSRQKEPAASGTDAGFVTGLTCAVIIMLVLIIMVIIAIIAPPPPVPGQRVYIPVSFLAPYLVVMALLINIAGVLLALIAGGLGGSIGKRWLAKHARYG